MKDPYEETNQAKVDLEDEFLKERLRRWGGEGYRQSFDPFLARRPRKSKWTAGLLSFFVPGTGQLYLGLMQRGIGIMLLLALNIVAVVFTSIHAATNIPLLVLFSLMIPVIYFYNIFDALQQADRMNGSPGTGSYEDWYAGSGTAPTGKTNTPFGGKGGLGYVLIAGGVLLFMISSKPHWLNKAFEFLGSSVGAVLLIVIGVYLFFKESRKP